VSLLANPVARRQMGVAARAQAAAEFSTAALAQRTETVYYQALSAATRRLPPAAAADPGEAA
jgi:hypothetical protein